MPENDPAEGSLKRPFTLAGISLLHGLVDALGTAILFHVAKPDVVPWTAPLVLYGTYGIIAFGSRPLVGLIVDARSADRAATTLGAIMMCAALPLLYFAPLAALLLAALANAIFHAGGGSASFLFHPMRALAPGVFAASGPLGVLAGVLLGARAYSPLWPVAAVTLALAVVVARGSWSSRRPASGPQTPTPPELLILFPMALIAILALVGFSLAFPWTSAADMVALLALAAALGRGAGGALADLIGFKRLAVTSLVLAIPLLLAGPQSAWIGLAGVMLLNMALPVATTAVYRAVPRFPSFAFGAASLALIIGAAAQMAGIRPAMTHTMVVLGLIPVAAALALVGLAAPEPTSPTLARDSMDRNPQEA